YPAYAQVTQTVNGAYTWLSPTNDVRAPQRASGNGRLASTWYGFSDMAFDINLTDGASHQVAMYFLDWDNSGRCERVDVIPAGPTTPADSRTLCNFSGGVYLVWNIRGQARVLVTRTQGPNAVVSGLFFDTACAPGMQLSGDLNFGNVLPNDYGERTLT